MTKKTYKREVATILLCSLVPAYYFGGTELTGLLVWPIFGFASAAFGLDALSKQVLDNT
jgi:hypothetical protein